MEVLSALYQHDVRVKTANFIYGLGGRDLFPQDVEQGFRVLQAAAEGADTPRTRVYLNVKGA